MKLYSRIVCDMETGVILAAEWTEYTGPVAECKKKKSKKLAEDQMKFFNDLLKQDLEFRRQFLMPLLPALAPFLSGERGFSDASLAAMRGEAIEGTSRRFEDLGSRLKARLGQRGAAGGLTPMSGDFSRNLLGLGAMEESERAGALRDINVRDELLALQNMFGAANVLSGTGAQFRADPFVGGSSSALSNRTQLGLAKPFWQDLLLAGVGGASQAAGAAAMGAMGGGGGGGSGGGGSGGGG